MALLVRLWPGFPLLWVLQVVGSNPAAPTKTISVTFDANRRHSGQMTRLSAVRVLTPADAMWRFEHAPRVNRRPTCCFFLLSFAGWETLCAVSSWGREMRKRDAGYDFDRYRMLLAEAVDETKRLAFIDLLVEERARDRLEGQRVAERNAITVTTIAKVLGNSRT